MQHFVTIVVLTSLAGAALPVGGLLARIERLLPRWLEKEMRHAVIAFGGGVLVAAVALVLVPQGMRALSAPIATICLTVGGVAALFADRALARSGKPAANLLAALLDFLPEAIALGALIPAQPELGALLAAFIALQNIPEGFSAYRELTAGGRIRTGRALRLLTASALAGPVCGLLGYWLLADVPQVSASIMLFGSGGILYLVFQDIAPQAKLARHWGPPLGAVLGFALGMIGTMLTTH